MKWQPMPAEARLAGAARAQRLLDARRARLDVPGQAEAREACGERDGHLRGRQLVRGAEQLAALLVELAEDARAQVGGPVEEMVLELVLDDRAFLLDDQHLLEPGGELARALRLERPGQGDAVEAGGFRSHGEQVL
ncbi:MAG: hypothetical protein ACO3EK_11990, partial [Alphaproteobacteria bacterium]